MSELERCGVCYVSPLSPSLRLCRKCDGLVPCARPGCGEPYERHRVTFTEDGARYTFRPYGAKADACEGFVTPTGYQARGA